MKKFILALLPMAMLFTGCENACEKGLELKTKLLTLETTVTGTITTPGSLDHSCAGFRATTNQELRTGAEFATHVAYDYFYSEERRCARGHFERRCHYGSPDHYPSNYYCRTIYVCDDVEVIAHKRDGFEQAVELSTLLAGTERSLVASCSAHERGEAVDAIVHLASAKLQIRDAGTDVEAVLRKAGCYDRRGN